MRFPAAILAALLPCTALAVTQVEAARATESQAAKEVASIRASRAMLEGDLDRVAREIELRKATAGAVVRSGELDELLRRSRDLSARLEDLSRTEAASFSRVQEARRALADALDAAISTLRGRYDTTTDRAEAAQVLREMKALRAEQTGLRGAAGGAAVPSLATGGGDPVELLEQADALKDAADKLRRHVAELDVRIRDLRDERDIDRRMRDLTSESALFDDTDRRLRDAAPANAPRGVGPQSVDLGANDKSTAFGPTAGEATGGGAGDNRATPPSGGLPGGSGLYLDASPLNGRQAFAPAVRANATQAPLRDATPPGAEGLDPALSVPDGKGSALPPTGARVGASTPDENLGLEVLERQRRDLAAQATELVRRAADLERRAKSLR